MPPLHRAVKEGDVSRVEEMFAKKWWRRAPDVNKPDEWGCTPLHYAAEQSSDILVHFLIQQGADVNSSNRFGHQPLHNAARNGLVETMRLLLDNGADIDACAGNDGTALHWAVKQGQTEIIKLLKQRGARMDVTNKKGRTALAETQILKREDLSEILSSDAREEI